MKHPILYAFLFLFIFSRYLYFIPHYPKNVSHLNEYQFYQDLHQNNKEHINNQISISNTPIDSSMLPVIQEFTRHVGIIDYNVELQFYDKPSKK